MRLEKSTSSTIWMVAVLFAIGVTSQASLAQKAERPLATNQTDTLAAVQPQVEQLLLVIGENQHGQISKEEFLDYMQAAFAKIDKDNSGQIKCADLEKAGAGVVPAAKMGR